MQGQDKQTGLASDRFALAHRSPDLGDAREENQDTAGVLPGIQQFHSLPHLNMKQLGGVRQMSDRQLKQLSLRSKDRPIFKVSSYRRVADITMMRISGRARWRRFKSASARSLSRWRS